MSKNKLAYNQLSHTNTSSLASIPTGDIYIQIETAELEERFRLLSKQIALAARRAALRTRNWLQTQLVRELSARAALPQKGIKARFRRGRHGDTKEDERNSQAYSNEGYAVLWIGLNPVDAQTAGTPRQNKKSAGPRPIPGAGTKVGRHFFDRAFIANIYGPGEKVWRRKSMGARSKAFPVVKMTVPINEAMEEILPLYEAAAARMFSQRLEHECNYLIANGYK